MICPQGTPIVVDAFGRLDGAPLLYFLSHMHTGARCCAARPCRRCSASGYLLLDVFCFGLCVPAAHAAPPCADHLTGLNPTWRQGPLYCSPVSRALLMRRFPGVFAHTTTRSLRCRVVFAHTAARPLWCRV